jgi:predicted nucleic-acid-binding Zn-ribbon protein
MKHSNTCPKCQFNDIIRIPARLPASSGENIVNIGLMKAVKVTRYVCATCGFSEEWVESHDDIEKLRARHEPLPPSS